MAVSTACALDVALRRVVGRPLLKDWPLLFEYGTLFMRAQFNHAFRLSDDIAASRAYFDSVYGLIETYSDVVVRSNVPGEPRGEWFLPAQRLRAPTLLHFHGGGYAFYADISRHLAASLAHHLGVAVFAPDYRLTPEHPHPAQLEDALAAYTYLLNRGVVAEELVLCGDSAGGHLALMTLASLPQAKLPRPLLTMTISPWTDVGRRGASQFGNDPYDLVQGYMTLQFAAWLKGGTDLSDAELSPIAQDFRGLGPIYLQAGDPRRHDSGLRSDGRRPGHTGPTRRVAGHESRVPRVRQCAATEPRGTGSPGRGHRLGVRQLVHLRGRRPHRLRQPGDAQSRIS